MAYTESLQRAPAHQYVPLSRSVIVSSALEERLIITQLAFSISNLTSVASAVHLYIPLVNVRSNSHVLTVRWDGGNGSAPALVPNRAASDWVAFDVTQDVDLAQRQGREFVHMEVDGNVEEEEEHAPFPLVSHLRETLSFGEVFSSSTVEIKMSVERGCTYTGRCIDQIDLSVETLVFSMLRGQMVVINPEDTLSASTNVATFLPVGVWM